MKKFAITLMLGALMLPILAGCGKNEEVDSKNDKENVVTATEAPTPTDTTPEGSADAEAAGGSEGAVGGSELVDDNAESTATEEITVKVLDFNGSNEITIIGGVDKITNYSDIIAQYRTEIENAMTNDLTAEEGQSCFPEGVLKSNTEVFDPSIVSDDDKWLIENSDSFDKTSMTREELATAIHEKLFISAVYKILDDNGISRDSIASLTVLPYVQGCKCEINGDITSVEISLVNAYNDKSYEMFFFVYHADGSADQYSSLVVMPVTF